MEKNTIWAISLSTIVLVAFFAIQTIFFPQQNIQTQNEVSQETISKTEESSSPENSSSGAELVKAEIVGTEEYNHQEEEKFFTITTEKAKVTFTNKGGDIISYELIEKDEKGNLKNLDRDTGKGIEMVTNVSPNSNRAFSLAFGNAEKSILNDIFKVYEDKENNRISFAKSYKVNDSEFILAKTYSFKKDDYVFELEVTIDGKDSFKELNIDNSSYTLRTSPQIGPYFNQKQNRYEYRHFISFNGEKSKKIVLGSNQVKSYEKPWTWAALAGKYFEIIVKPVNSETMNDSVVYSSKIEVNDSTNAQLRLSRKPVTGVKEVSDKYLIYVGPRNEKELKKYSLPEHNAWSIEDSHFDESMQTFGIFSWLEVILKLLLENINKVVKNWGISIIILTLFLRICMFPLTKKSLEGTQKMQKFQPKMQELQAKYKGNPAKLQQETAKMYQEIGYNPMSGCLPMLLQFVILWSMYNLFNNYFEFRGASFISGWIDDLSTGDHIGKVFERGLPFLGWNQIRILPVIYVISQLLFGKITQNGGTAVGQNQSQMKMMMYGMPLFFFFIFYNAPSGLLLYWTVSNLFQLGQQLVMNKMMKNTKQ